MNDNVITQSKRSFTVEEYLRLEKKDGTKHEFYQGKVLSKSGSGRRHNLICSNMTIAIGSRVIKQRNEVYVNDMRVRLNSKSFCYPDLIVVGAEPKFDAVETDVLLNPTVIVEVLSPSTSMRDKTEKLEGYLAMESVRDCLLVREDEMKVEQYSKQSQKQWLYKIYDGREDIISIDSVNCKISMSEVYSQIKFGIEALLVGQTKPV
jgi:Uma2 family endonuclease